MSHPVAPLPDATPSVLALVGEHPACAAWRVWQPFAALQQRGYAAEWVWKDDPRGDRLAAAFDAYLLPRVYWRPAFQADARRWFAAVHRAGKLAWYEADDDIFSEWVVPQQKAGVGADKTLEELERERQWRLAALRWCDGAVVSTQRLATVVARYTDAPVAVVPNAIDLRWFRAVQATQKRTVPPLTVGWAGGARPDRDVDVMAEAWGRIARRYPAVTFVVQGHQPRCVYDQVPAERIRAIDWLPVEAYPLGLANVDIACCPLADAPFNRSKTPIKAWEAAASGSAVVASPTVYGQVIEHGATGYLCETADAWEDALAHLIEDEDRRQRLARRLLRRVEREHSLETQWWRWPAAWADLAARARTFWRAA